MAETWLVVWLGNPGVRYEATRHNVGQMVVDVLAQRAGARWTAHRSKAVIAKARLGTLPGGAPGPAVILAKSTGYMNESGRPLAHLMHAEGIDTAHLLVVHDELDLPSHDLRLKYGGGEGGHNGLKSISRFLTTKDYARLRIGIDRPPGRMDPADYVLTNFPSAERTEWDVTVQLAADAVEDVLIRGFEKAQMDLHTS